mmetsp:Transcript_18976/g.26717  ORF Transcript_18976/g.26717 Transcript_18976/m.26717 type:complete len:115 (+) Transcript_18976:703-1047(+)
MRFNRDLKKVSLQREWRKSFKELNYCMKKEFYDQSLNFVVLSLFVCMLIYDKKSLEGECNNISLRGFMNNNFIHLCVPLNQLSTIWTKQYEMNSQIFSFNNLKEITNVLNPYVM